MKVCSVDLVRCEFSKRCFMAGRKSLLGGRPYILQSLPSRNRPAAENTGRFDHLPNDAHRTSGSALVVSIVTTLPTRRCTKLPATTHLESSFETRFMQTVLKLTSDFGDSKRYPKAGVVKKPVLCCSHLIPQSFDGVLGLSLTPAHVHSLLSYAHENGNGTMEITLSTTVSSVSIPSHFAILSRSHLDCIPS